MARASSPTGDQVEDKLVLFLIFLVVIIIGNPKPCVVGFGYELLLCCPDLCFIHLQFADGVRDTQNFKQEV